MLTRFTISFSIRQRGIILIQVLLHSYHDIWPLTISHNLTIFWCVAAFVASCHVSVCVSLCQCVHMIQITNCFVFHPKANLTLLNSIDNHMRDLLSTSHVLLCCFIVYMFRFFDVYTMFSGAQIMRCCVMTSSLNSKWQLVIHKLFNIGRYNAQREPVQLPRVQLVWLAADLHLISKSAIDQPEKPIKLICKQHLSVSVRQSPPTKPLQLIS